MAGGKIDILIDPDTRGFDSKLAAGLKGASGIAGKVGKGIGLAIVAGTAAAGFGLASVIKVGKEYQSQLNTLQAVTSATGVEMQRVAATAKALGADMSLPATSAADAAAAMTELAKGGFNVQQAMLAAKGTLQLAAAAQIDAASAAEIQANALNTFGLKADQAGRVADVLANTANAASGEITDMAQALQQAGSVANQMGISIEDTATALGLLANAGIKGSDAGTLLKTALTQLSSPSKPAAAAMKDLGLKAFDASGKFVGLKSIMDQLNGASHRMTQEQFAAATSTVFGTDAVRLAGVAAQTTTAEWDAMAQAVSKAGGAQELAAAKTKGVGGAIEGLKSQLETAGIGIFEAIDQPLEKLTRSASNFVASATPAVVRGIETIVAAGEVFGPRLAEALKSRGAVIVRAVHDVLAPVAKTIPDLLNAGINASIDLWDDFTRVLEHAVDAAKPVANGIASVAKASVDAGGPVSALLTALRLGGDILGTIAGVLVPIGHLVGGLASAFASLPGPIQTTVIALGLLAAFRGRLADLGETVKSRVTTPLRTLNDEILLQRGLADQAGQSVGRFGGALGVLESRVPAIGRMGDAFRSTSTAIEQSARANAVVISSIGSFTGEATRLGTALGSAVVGAGKVTGAIAGIGAAAGSALRTGVSGLIGAFGGPWGAAIAGASIALSVLAGRQQEAAQKAAEHRSRLETLTSAFRDSKGAITDAVREQQIKAAQDSHLLDVTDRLGVSQQTVTKALLGNRDAITEVNAAFDKFGITATETGAVFGRNLQVFDGLAGEHGLGSLARIAVEARGKFGELTQGLFDAQDKAARFEEAVRKGNVSMLDATGAGRTLSGAMDVLRDSTASADDRARALKDALDALSGGQVNLEAAQSRLNEQLARLGDVFGENVDKAKGWGAALLNANGTINTTTENGRRLFDSLGGISESMAEVAQKTFDVATKQGDDLPAALSKAKVAAEQTRQAFIDQHDAMGLTAEQASVLADRYGLIPSDVATLITAPGMDATQIELILLRDLVNKVPGDKPITVRSLSDEAKKKLIDLGFVVTTLPDGTVTVQAHDQAARDRLNSLIGEFQNRVVNIRVVPIVSDAKLRKEANTQATGGILAKAYAAGGVQRLTPMRGGVADIVPPNTWRIVGDRMVDDEAYIPINRSSRSAMLLQQTASRMGFDLIRRFALGGLASPAVTGLAVEASNPLVIENHIEIGGEVVRVVRTEISSSNKATRTRILAGAGGER